MCVGFKEWSVMIALTGCEPVQPPEEFVELLQTECVESSCIESLWTAGRSLGMLPPQGAGLGVPTASKTRPTGSTSDQFGEVTQKFQLFPPATRERDVDSDAFKRNVQRRQGKIWGIQS